MSFYRNLLMLAVFAVVLALFTSSCVVVNSNFILRGTNHQVEQESQAGANSAAPSVGETTINAEKTAADAYKLDGNSASVTPQLNVGINK